ncbi:MAG: PqqD family protein [Deltaproteobacteria bacterium]|nr:PqqD family protein [Deltaproteobacteria bacterium]
MPDGTKIVTREDCLKPNQEMVFRKEEEGAFLFDPHTGNLKYLNANGVNIYELCDGRKTVGDIITLLMEFYPEMAVEKIAADTKLFFENLAAMQFLTKCESHGS